MGLKPSFDALSRIVEQYEASGRTVRHVEVTGEGEKDCLQVELEVPVSLCAASGEGAQPRLTPEQASLTDRGGLAVEFSSSEVANLAPDTDTAVTASEEAVHVDEGTLVLSVALRIDPDAAASAAETRTETTSPGDTDDEMNEVTSERSEGAAEKVERAAGAADGDTGPEDELAAVRDRSVPPYDDVAYLEALYETCDTFTAMSETIEMDVSSETVRRYMIEAGVHDPTSYDATGASEGKLRESDTVEATTDPSTADDPIGEIPDEQLVTDGIGLPQQVKLEDVADAVVDSMTVHEVTRRLGLERERTTELLKQLNLIDLTLRRVDEYPEEPVTYEQVADRIRQSVPSSV